jgi:hypothetical protein
MKVFVFGSVLTIFVAAGCKHSSSSSTPTSPSPADPTRSENFAGTLAVGGAVYYSFSVGVYGTVNVSLVSIGGKSVPPDQAVNVGLGQPSGQTCGSSPTSVSTTGANLVTAAENPGVYCVTVSDDSSILPAPANFVVSIAHP